MSTLSNSKEEAYRDRNLAVMALASLAQKQGYPVGIQQDLEQPDWPVIMIQLPTGQVGWHIPAKELTGQWSEFADQWDGHNIQEKHLRLKAFINQGKKPEK